jgi:hypothetical protein
MTRAARLVRPLVALLVLAALATTTRDAVHDGLLAQNLSYFTNQSNLMFAAILLAVWLLRGRRTPWLEDVRGAIAFYLVMTGIIYALLVAPLDELLRWDIGWTGIVLHRLAPAVAIADWVLTPRRGAPGPRRILWWQAYPVVFLFATWIRGAATDWYPYTFLDPTASSWTQVLVTTAVVLAAFLAVATLVHLAAGRARSGRTTPVGAAAVESPAAQA